MPQRSQSKSEKKPTHTYQYKETFADIIGMDKVKEIIKDNLILSLKHPELFEKYNQQRRIGIILYGATGVGKTAMVKAISGEAKINAMLVKIDEIIDQYTGQTEKHIHEKFEEAREIAPCILFFDELDALGIKRSGLGKEGTAQVMRQAVETFLIEMDSASAKNENLFVMGATNNPWDIDPALRRSGRFDLSIYIAPPNIKDRKKLFKYYLMGKPISKINYSRLSRCTIGYSGADIKRICESATKFAIKREANTGKDQYITTNQIIGILKDKDLGKSTLNEWFAQIEKEQVSSTKTIISGDEKRKVKESGNMSEEERMIYSDLIKDIRRRKKDKAINDLIRWVSLNVM